MKRAFAVMALMLLTGAPALAEGALTVHVIDAHTHRPLRGIPVTVTGNFGDLDGISDRLGNVNFLNVPTGRATAVAADEYTSPCTPYFTISSGQRRTVTLVVSPRRRGESQSQDLCVMPGLVNPGEGADVYDIH